MARLAKLQLLHRIQAAITDAGWEVELLSERNVHPLELRMSRGRVRFNVRAYIWNLSHGGRTRSADEYRIQVTSGVGRFERMTGEQTLILGWSEAFGTFAAFDFDRHSGALGSSPSLQISRGTLEAARDHGVAARSKGNNEIVIALRPEFLGAYIEQRAKLHNPAEAQAVVQALRESVSSPDLSDVATELETFADRIRGGAKPRLGSAEEKEQRHTVLDRLAALEEEINRIRAQPGMIGHNRPPPDNDEVEPSLEDVESAAEAIKEELEKPNPDAAVVAENASLIERASRAWGKLTKEMGKLGGVLKEKARERLVEVLFLGAGALIVLMQKIAAGVLAWLHVTLS